MTEKQWRECLGELVRDYMRSPEMDFYFSIKMNKPRAAVMVQAAESVRAPPARLLGPCVGQLPGDGG